MIHTPENESQNFCSHIGKPSVTSRNNHESKITKQGVSLFLVSTPSHPELFPPSRPTGISVVRVSSSTFGVTEVRRDLIGYENNRTKLRSLKRDNVESLSLKVSISS